MSFGWSGTSQRRNLGALHTVNPDGSPAAWLIEQGGVKTCREVPPLDIEDGLERNLQQGSNFIRVLSAMQEAENTGAGLDSGRRFAAFDDGCQRAELGFA